MNEAANELDAFLGERNVARLATASPAGAPYVTPVWYEWEAGVLRLVLAESRPHVSNLRSNPAVAVCVDVDPRPALGLEAGARGVTLLGEAELSDPVALAEGETVVTPVFLRIAAHYLGSDFARVESQPAAIRAERRALVTLRPARVVSWRA